MKIAIVHAGMFKLDGGAMFGVVPQKLWQKLNPPDQNNLCTWALRCLLVEDGERKILIDTGMGDKQNDKFLSHFEPHGDTTVDSELNRLMIKAEEITDVFLTHLHFDHCGGALTKARDGNIIPAFPNAKYWTNQKHLEWALNPNPREQASFLKDNIVPLVERNLFNYVAVKDGVHFSEHITVDFYYGHTEAMMVPTLHFPDGNKLIFPTDLFPSKHHVRMPYVMSYDIRPLETLKEKARFYEKILSPNCFLFFEHDKDDAFGQLIKNDKGRYAIEVANQVPFEFI